MDLNRRSLITGLIALVAAPAIVRAGSLMPVKRIVTDADCQAMINEMYRYWDGVLKAALYGDHVIGDHVIGIDPSGQLVVRPIRSEMLFRVNNQTNRLFISHRDS